MKNGTTMRLRALCAVGLVILALLALAPATLAATPGRYAGETSQGMRVNIRVTSATRANITTNYRGRCTNGKRFTASATVERMKLSARGFFLSREEGKGRFAGVGRGTFRYRFDGQVRKNVAEGTFRATFTSGSVTCRSSRVKFSARRR